MVEALERPETTRWAASLIEAGWRAEFGRDPEPGELVGALAQSHAESSWGRGWKGPCAESRNWGAIHGYYKGQSCPGVDTVDGRPSTAYETAIRAYPSHEEGAADFVHVAYGTRWSPQAAMQDWDWDGMAAALKVAPAYYGLAQDQYAAAIKRRAPWIAEHLGLEPPKQVSPLMVFFPVALALGVFLATLGIRRKDPRV